jgi:hypothetical protein
MSNVDKKDYLVGYGKPPTRTQFKTGQSGNPKGRPRGSLSLMTVIERELNSKVTVTEQGQQKKVRKKEVVAKQLVNKAASGDLKATNLVLSHSISSEHSDKGGGLVQEKKLRLPLHDKTFESILERMQNCRGKVSLESGTELKVESPRKSAPSRRRVKLI